MGNNYGGPINGQRSERVDDGATHEELMQSSNYYADTYYFQEVEEEFNAH
jgi:hypothetical protein